MDPRGRNKPLVSLQLGFHMLLDGTMAWHHRSELWVMSGERNVSTGNCPSLLHTRLMKNYTGFLVRCLPDRVLAARRGTFRFVYFAGYIGDDFVQCPWAPVSRLNASKSWAPSSPGIVWTKQWWRTKFGGSNGPNKNHNYPQKKKLRDSVVPETSKHLYYFLSVFQNLKEAFSFEGVPEGGRNKYVLVSPHIYFCLPHILAPKAYNLNLSGLVAAMTYVWDAPYAGGERWRCSPKALLRTDVNPWHRQGDLLFG